VIDDIGFNKLKTIIQSDPDISEAVLRELIRFESIATQKRRNLFNKYFKLKPASRFSVRRYSDQFRDILNNNQ
jgi:hypothetical protein